MDNETFHIGSKAEDLYFNIFDITTNRKHYPVKFRRLADKLQECALDIYGNVMDANSYSPKHSGRIENQTKAITNCNKLESLIKYSLHAQLISFATSELWIKMVHDVKYMTLAWRNKT